MRDHELLQPEKPVFDWELDEKTVKDIKSRIGYAIEDGRLDVGEAENMSLLEMKQWLEDYDHDYDPY